MWIFSMETQTELQHMARNRMYTQPFSWLVHSFCSIRGIQEPRNHPWSVPFSTSLKTPKEKEYLIFGVHKGIKCALLFCVKKELLVSRFPSPTKMGFGVESSSFTSLCVPIKFQNGLNLVSCNETTIFAKRLWLKSQTGSHEFNSKFSPQELSHLIELLRNVSDKKHKMRGTGSDTW